MLDGNHDPKLRTFIVYVPTVGAEEEDVPEATQVVTGGNARHYWEDSGIIGKLYRETLVIDAYAFDAWMIYQPGVIWEGELPPAPAFWMHNLGVDEAPRLDSKEFAIEVEKYLKQDLN